MSPVPELLPYLELRDPESGNCLTLVDNCQTTAIIANVYGESEASSCECCPECEQGSYTGNPVFDGAWWADGADPAANSFHGFLATSVWLEPAASIRRRGETTADRPPYSPRQLRVRGRLLANSRDGTYFGETEILKVLTEECGPCDGWEATLRLFCPDYDPGDVVPPKLWTPDDLPPLIGEPDDCEPCSNQDPDWVPRPLGPSFTGQVTSVDSGRRTVMRLRFVAMDEDLDVDVSTPYCMGSDVELLFEVLDDYEWGDPIDDVCTIDRPFDDFESGHCRPHDWKSCLIIPEAPSCDDPELSPNATTSVEPVRSARARSAKYCQPLYRTVKSCLTPELPTSADVALEVAVWSGEKELRNFRIDLFPAFTGVPSPETCEGESIYQRMVPCGQMMLPYLPADSWVIVDGRRGETWLYCQGRTGEKANNLVEGWGHTVFDPSCRMWIVATADCFNTGPGAAIEVTYHPRYTS